MLEKITIAGIEYTVLVQFTSEKTNRDYIIYSTLEPKNHIIDIYSGVLNGDLIEEVTTEEEQQIIDKMISTLATTPKGTYKLVKE